MTPALTTSSFAASRGREQAGNRRASRGFPGSAAITRRYRVSAFVVVVDSVVSLSSAAAVGGDWHEERRRRRRRKTRVINTCVTAKEPQGTSVFRLSFETWSYRNIWGNQGSLVRYRIETVASACWMGLRKFLNLQDASGQDYHIPAVTFC